MSELAEHGVSHIELRMIDLNPLFEAGIAPDDLKFLLLFLTWLEWKPAIHADANMQEVFVRNMIAASHMPLEEETIIGPDGRSVPLVQAAERVLDDMESYLGEHPAIICQREKLKYPQKRYAVNLQKGFGEDFVKKGLIYVTERTKNEMLLAELESCDGMDI